VADGKDANDVRTRALITTHLTVITATTSIQDAARSMVTGHFRHLPVVGEAGLIGMADITEVRAALLHTDAASTRTCRPQAHHTARLLRQRAERSRT